MTWIINSLLIFLACVTAYTFIKHFESYFSLVECKVNGPIMVHYRYVK